MSFDSVEPTTYRLKMRGAPSVGLREIESYIDAVEETMMKEYGGFELHEIDIRVNNATSEEITLVFSIPQVQIDPSYDISQNVSKNVIELGYDIDSTHVLSTQP